MDIECKLCGSFPWVFPSELSRITQPVKAVAAATNVFIEVIYRESVDNAHNSLISPTFQKSWLLTEAI